MTLLGKNTLSLCHSQPTQPTGLFETLELGSLETTAQRVRPDIVHETCGDPAAGPEPTALRASRGSRTSTGKMALKEVSARDVHRQEQTTLPGIWRHPCGSHFLANAKKESVMFAHEDEGFQELYDRLLACSSTKQSITMSENKKTHEERWSNGRRRTEQRLRKRKVERKKARRGKVRTTWAMSCAGIVVSLATTRRTVDRSGHSTCGGQEAKAKAMREVTNILMDGLGKVTNMRMDGLGKVTNMRMDGLGVKSMLMGCGKRQTGRMVEDSKRLDTMGIRKTMGGIEFNSIEECCSMIPRRGEKQETSESDGRRRGTPAPKPSPTPKPTLPPSEDSDSATSEPSGMSETGASDTSETSSTSNVETQEWNDPKTYCDKLAKLQRMRCKLLDAEQKAPKRVFWCTCGVEEGHNVEASLRWCNCFEWHNRGCTFIVACNLALSRSKTIKANNEIVESLMNIRKVSSSYQRSRHREEFGTERQCETQWRFDPCRVYWTFGHVPDDPVVESVVGTGWRCMSWLTLTKSESMSQNTVRQAQQCVEWSEAIERFVLPELSSVGLPCVFIILVLQLFPQPL